MSYSRTVPSGIVFVFVVFMTNTLQRLPHPRKPPRPSALPRHNRQRPPPTARCEGRREGVGVGPATRASRTRAPKALPPRGHYPITDTLRNPHASWSRVLRPLAHANA